MGRVRVKDEVMTAGRESRTWTMHSELDVTMMRSENDGAGDGTGAYGDSTVGLQRKLTSVKLMRH